MVYIAKEDFDNYPNFSKFVLDFVPKVVGEPKILRSMGLAAFMTHQIFDFEIIQKTAASLTTGKPPRIIPTVFSDHSLAAEYKHVEQYILINAIHARKFDDNPDVPGYRKYIKATLLHELVHHWDYIADEEFQDHEIRGEKKIRKDEVEERGHVLERLAFGGTTAMIP